MDMDPFLGDGGHESRDEGKGGQHKPVDGGKAEGGKSSGNSMGKETVKGAGQ
jgi:hypothetical protein